MNVFKFELKSQLRSTVIWTVAVITLLLMFQSGIYPLYSESLDDVMEIMSGFPKAFIAAFGMNSETMFSFGGFFNLTYNYLSLMGAIMAAVLSITAFSREKRSKCLDFLLAKPCSRMTIFSAKLLSVLTLLLLSNLLTVLTAAVVFSATADLGKLILSLSGLFYTEIVFIALGTIFSIFAKKVRSVSGAAIAFGFGSFILSAMYGILNEEKMRYITPLKYFNPSAVYADGGFEGKYVVTAIIVIVVCIGTAGYHFCKYDTHAV
jgi:ABC-2 type transport system permease protein